MSKKQPIRIGNQTTFSALTPTQPFEYAVENGFDAFEWFPDQKESGAGWRESDLDSETRLYIKNTSLDRDIRLSVHVPWWANPLDSKAWERMVESIEFSKEIGACLLNVHLRVDDGINAYVEAIAPLVKRLKRAGIRLSIENTPFTGPEEFNALFAGLESLKYNEMRQVGMCLDIGHANLYAPTRNDFLKFIDQLSSQVPIIHVHLHENDGYHDSHLPLFTGPAGRDASGIEGVIKRLKKRAFSDCIILEQWPRPPSLLNKARDRLKDMIGNYGKGKEGEHETTKKDDHL